MSEMGISMRELYDYYESIGQLQYDLMTSEDLDEKEWLDKNVRGKEEELRSLNRKKIEVTDGTSEQKEG